MRRTISTVATLVVGAVLVWLDLAITAPFQDDAVALVSAAAAQYGYWWLPAAVQLFLFIAPIVAIAFLVASVLED